MRRWLEHELNWLIVTADDGQVVLYPYGPFFRAFALTHPAFQTVIKAYHRRFNSIFLVVFLLALVIGGAFGVAGMAILVACAAGQTLHVIFIRRLSRRLIPLPRSLGFRFHARWQNEQRLWESFGGSVLLCLFLAPFFVFRPNFMVGGFIAFIATFAVLFAMMLLARNREMTRLAAPSKHRPGSPI